MYSENSRQGIRTLLQEAALRYQRAAEEALDSAHGDHYRERAALLEELIGQLGTRLEGPAPVGAPAPARPPSPESADTRGDSR
ncbi:hypothetical protein AN478_09750 [Thiohalorhabdus denitrificans]|uniref:Uncharacterized protein n=1 Tax=Thiohalorhabdus denitrificans TaxID=381306 RepID=A0A0P9GHF6_9GAMM|nr:hypothetical protein [Thiohalorhabdus denitrificans]KPV39446.1 hypothetical protein AN478_09750 [Thiohalorhabdus denitrificans]SCY02694.1 hypothetical protein SAMN05661077_1088 [Thiohalorhabdus denitrificans]